MAFEPVYADSVPVSVPHARDAIHLTPQQQQVLGIEYAAAEYTLATRPLYAPARVDFNRSKLTRVQSKLEGFIDQLHVTAIGQHVRQGQLLLTIYNRRTYAMAQMQFLQASMDAAGMGQLPPGVDPTQKRLADAEALRLARLNLEMLGFTDDQIEAVARAHQSLTTVPIYAPSSGVIVEFNAALHEKLTMEPLLTIADLSSVWVTADFFGADAARIQSGGNATLTVPYLPGRTFHGQVEALFPALDADTHAIKARLVFDNPGEALRPEMVGDIELPPPAGHKILTVPADALIDSEGGKTVFLAVPGNNVQLKTVRTGRQLGERVEILSGLKPGNRVVTSGNFLLDGEAELRTASQP